MAEEHVFQAPEGHRLCANNCGFFGSPATLDLCSKCYRDHSMKEEQAKSAKSAVENSLFAASSSTADSAVPSAVVLSVTPAPVPSVLESAEDGRISSAAANRCSVCRKRVGLTGFKCRCAITFCVAHRYPEQHGCTFDYKAIGRVTITKANPVVKAVKLEKI